MVVCATSSLHSNRMASQWHPSTSQLYTLVAPMLHQPARSPLQSSLASLTPGGEWGCSGSLVGAGGIRGGLG